MPPAKPTTKSPSSSPSAIPAAPSWITSRPPTNGAPAPVKFGLTKTRGNPLDFSFSGLKTAVLYHLREHPEYNEEILDREAALEREQRNSTNYFRSARRKRWHWSGNFKTR